MKGTTQEGITKEVMDIAAKKRKVKGAGDISFQVTLTCSDTVSILL